MSDSSAPRQPGQPPGQLPDQARGQPSGEKPVAGLRVDAERNRRSILGAARSLYASEGLSVSMAAVAREAGVGKATLFRHFASPQHLIDAVFADRMQEYVRLTEAALADPDPWRAFAGYVTAVCQMQAADRGFADLLTLTVHSAPALERTRTRAYAGFVEIIERAKVGGCLREDFASEDMVLVLMANAGVLAATAGEAPDAWRRLVGQLLRAFAGPGAAPFPLTAAPSSAVLYRAMATGLNRVAATPARSEAPSSPQAASTSVPETGT